MSWALLAGGDDFVGHFLQLRLELGGIFDVEEIEDLIMLQQTRPARSSALHNGLFITQPCAVAYRLASHSSRGIHLTGDECALVSKVNEMLPIFQPGVHAPQLSPKPVMTQS